MPSAWGRAGACLLGTAAWKLELSSCVIQTDTLEDLQGASRLLSACFDRMSTRVGSTLQGGQSRSRHKAAALTENLGNWKPRARELGKKPQPYGSEKKGFPWCHSSESAADASTEQAGTWVHPCSNQKWEFQRGKMPTFGVLASVPLAGTLRAGQLSAVLELVWVSRAGVTPKPAGVNLCVHT